MVQLFSVPAFFIVFREVLEAALVIGVMLAYVTRAGADHLKKWVWWGTGVGVGCSILVGLGLGIPYWVAGDEVLTGKKMYIFEGFIYLIAACLITWMIIWMLMMGKNLRAAVERQIEDKLDKQNAHWWIFGSVFLNVFREGVEVVIFMIGIGETDWRAIPIPAVLGIIVGVVVSIMLFKGLLKLNIGAFFMATSMILVAFAAGLFSRSWHEFQEADWLGLYQTDNSLERPWWNAIMWSTKACCNDKENQFFAMLRALFGYQDTPTYLEFITYFGYWFLFSWVTIYIYREQVFGRRDRTASFVKTSSCVMAFAAFIGWIFALSYQPEEWNNNVSWIAVMMTTLMFFLSLVAVFISFDFFACRWQAIAQRRRAITIGVAACWAVLLVLAFALTTAQMVCGANVPQSSCSLPVFFYWNLIFSVEWATQAQTTTQYTSLALLSIALVISMFYCGFHSFWTFVMARDIDQDGLYNYTPTVTHDDKYGAIESFADIEEGMHTVPGKEVDGDDSNSNSDSSPAMMENEDGTVRSEDAREAERLVDASAA
ncbi:Ferrous iron permease EfeU [Porphyridium purpureum]|uniref:Ferrous iron permease EfeU n=1 Tax=Porphyridium purpureum TaxID=35688 RepID=A0A5J4YZ07_PORPP|nr:Ferrous iron permease EfeU [Porphyridium purpureum]|eukprot:POR0225..scf209_3